MGLIIGTKIKQLKKGYPTVSDKYNVAGGLNSGEDNIVVGEVVMIGAQTGYYTKAASLTADKIAGIALATNVKLATKYPAGDEAVEIAPGEAIDLFKDGYIAVEVATSDLENIKENVAVKVAADGKTFGTAEAIAYPGATFTGIVEKINDEVALAEICVK